MTVERVLTPTQARRLAISRQRLAGPPPSADAATMLDVVRDLGCLQLDPISAVARSHLLVLWSRLGAYDPAVLDTLLWQERWLFEYWAHCASIVLTEDYPLHQLAMRGHAMGISAWAQRARLWLAENEPLRRHILAELECRGPVLAQHLEDVAVTGWQSSGWTAGRNVSRMLDFLWIKGEIMVAGRQRGSGQKLWDLASRCLPDWTPREPLTEGQVVRLAVQRALRALGVARPAHIRQHFIRGRYPGLEGVLTDLEAEGQVVRVGIDQDGTLWPGQWYMHSADLSLLDRLVGGDWIPRTTLLSPFDNLICDRARTEALFGFQFRIEIYVPRAKRRWGYYVLPILHGDRLIGRIDPTMDRRSGRLTINAVWADPDAPRTDETARAVAGAIAELGGFLGAREIAYTGSVPDDWQSALR